MAQTANAEPGFAETARGLVRAADRASLATLMRDGGGPYASLVLIAADHDASPILLISNLADHTKNLAADSRASLLVDGTAGLESPLTGARASLVGTIAQSTEPRHRRRFLARHPDAAGYADFGDFAVYRMQIERVHLVAGFGRIRWIEAERILVPIRPALAERESDIVEHMNADHADAVELYAGRLLGRSGSGWRMTGIDPEGIDLRRAGEVARLAFERPVEEADSARAELVRLAKRAREAARPE
jgi:putative heme iron utilization protein